MRRCYSVVASYTIYIAIILMGGSLGYCNNVEGSDGATATIYNTVSIAIYCSLALLKRLPLLTYVEGYSTKCFPQKGIRPG